MTEEPEDVLEQNRVTTTRGREEARAEVDIHEHHSYRTRQDRHNRNKQERRDEPCPNEQWHLHVSHAGGTHVHDGCDDVDRTHDG